MGDMQRILAERHGVDIHELNNRNLEGSIDTDTEIDAFQRSLGDKDNLVVDSRLGYHFLPKSIKLFLDASPSVRAERLLERKGAAENVKNADDAAAQNEGRKLAEITRWKKLYNTNPFEMENYDLVLDSSEMTPEELVQQVLNTFPGLSKPKSI